MDVCEVLGFGLLQGFESDPNLKVERTSWHGGVTEPNTPSSKARAKTV